MKAFNIDVDVMRGNDATSIYIGSQKNSYIYVSQIVGCEAVVEMYLKHIDDESYEFKSEIGRGLPICFPQPVVKALVIRGLSFDWLY